LSPTVLESSPNSAEEEENLHELLQSRFPRIVDDDDDVQLVSIRPAPAAEGGKGMDKGKGHEQECGKGKDKGSGKEASGKDKADGVQGSRPGPSCAWKRSLKGNMSGKGKGESAGCGSFGSGASSSASGSAASAPWLPRIRSIWTPGPDQLSDPSNPLWVPWDELYKLNEC
jgi:hypothetical protein